jgi:hypothetical protein
MNSITLTAVGQSTYHDDRTPLFLEVVYTDETYNWFLRMPPTYEGSFNTYIASKEQAVYDDIEAKLQIWNNLDPKTRVIEGNTPEETIIVDIQKEEIVCPTYPDYYVKRAMEYPTPANQLDAYWKGGADRDAMQAKIEAIKVKYPKDSP